MPLLSRLAYRQLYRPSRYSSSALSDYLARLPFPARLLPFQDAIEVDPAEGTDPQGVAVLFHGNKGSAASFAYRAQPFVERGWRVVLAEYRGYGARPGRPSETALVQDAVELLEWVRGRHPGTPLLVVGKSLGTGVAVQAAAHLTRTGHPPEHLVLVTPFMSIAQVAKKWVPERLVQWALTDRFESCRHLVAYKGPVTIVVALKDKVTEPAQGLRLTRIAARRGPVALLRLPQAHHTDWYTHMTAAQWDELMQPPALARVAH